MVGLERSGLCGLCGAHRLIARVRPSRRRGVGASTADILSDAVLLFFGTSTNAEDGAQGVLPAQRQLPKDGAREAEIGSSGQSMT